MTLFGSPERTSLLMDSHVGLLGHVKPQGKNLWVMFDPDLWFDKQMNSVVRSSFYPLRLATRIKAFVTPKPGKGSPGFYYIPLRPAAACVWESVGPQ